MLAGMTCIAIALTASADAIERARNWLVSAQEASGRFATNRFGATFDRGITGLSALALIESKQPTHRDAAKRALTWLAKHPKLKEAHAHAFATWALCVGAKVWPDDFRAAADAALRTIVDGQNASGGWGYACRPADVRSETCLAGLMVAALGAARRAGSRVPNACLKNASRLIESRYKASLQVVNAGDEPSPSYAATALAATLGGQLAGCSKWLRRQPIREEGQRPEPFAGYLRGRFRFERFAHARAVALAEDDAYAARWAKRMGKLLVGQQKADDSWDGWYGPAYGTALALLTLQPPR